MDNFKTIIQSTEKKYLYLIFILCLLHSLHGFIYTCIPFIFYDPILTCYSMNNETNITFICDQNTACDKYQYEINKNESFYSITTEFELICSQRFAKPIIQSLMLAGTTISGFTMSFFKVNPFKRSKVMQCCYILGSLFGIITAFLDEIWIISAFLFFTYLFSYIWYANIYTYASETFQPPLKKIVPSLLTTSFGLGTMLFSMITLVVQNWRLLILFYYCFPALILTIIFFILDKAYQFSQKNIEIEQSLNLNKSKAEKKSKGFCEAFKNKALARNFLVYIFLWNMNKFSYNGCDIALGTLAGSLAFTMFFIGAVQAFCSFISGNLVLKFHEEILLKLTTLFMAFFLLLYIFEPQDKLNVEIYVSIFFILFMILANIGIELNWTILVNLLQKYIPIEFQQNVFAFGDLLAMVITLMLPYYIEFMVYISVSPIFGFGIFALFGRLVIMLLIKTEDTENNNYDESLLTNDKDLAFINKENNKNKEIEFNERNETN